MVDSLTVEQGDTAYVVGHDSTKTFLTTAGASVYREGLQLSFELHFRVFNRFPNSVFVQQFADSDKVEIKIAEVGCNLSKSTFKRTTCISIL